jgi:hypothetical protein
MPPLDHRRRRSITPTVLVVLVVAIALIVLIGGAVEIGTASGPYRRDVNRSYAAQGTVLIDQSNQTGVELRSLVADMPSLQRSALQRQLDGLVSASAQTATSAAALSPPAPSGTLGQGFAGALADRAQAVAKLRAAVDGLLGMSPLPVVGAPSPPYGSGNGAADADQVLLSANQASAEITDAATLIEQADRTYASVRRQFRAAPGNASLPRSVWMTNPQLWAAGPVQTLVDRVSGSSSLAPVHRVVLVEGGVRVTPAAVPPVQAAATAPSVVPPTGTLQVTAVVANQGNVDETGLVVSADVQPQGAGAPADSSETVSLAPTASMAVTLPSLKVAPGDTYSLTVSVTPPAAQSNRNETSQAFTIRVAPPAPPPTTTTTTQPTSH